MCCDIFYHFAIKNAKIIYFGKKKAILHEMIDKIFSIFDI